VNLQVLRLLPAHPPALCSLASLLETGAADLLGDGVFVGGQGGEGAAGGGVLAEGTGTGRVGDRAGEEGDEGGARGGGEDERRKEGEKLLFMAEELLLTAAEVVESVKYAAGTHAGSAGGGAGQAVEGRGMEEAGSGRWLHHKADVWAAYGGFLARGKRDVAGAARAFVEALKALPQHPTALQQYAELASEKMQNPRVAEYLFRQLLAVVPGQVDTWRKYGEVAAC